MQEEYFPDIKETGKYFKIEFDESSVSEEGIEVIDEETNQQTGEFVLVEKWYKFIDDIKFNIKTYLHQILHFCFLLTGRLSTESFIGSFSYSGFTSS